MVQCQRREVLGVEGVVVGVAARMRQRLDKTRRAELPE
jgi:hypothetical protein